MERSGLLELTVAEVLDHWPQTIPVFLHHGMACVGCVMAAFESPPEVAAVYGLPPSQFLDELHHTIQNTIQRVEASP